jgi:HNH endonuclease/AP2 domain
MVREIPLTKGKMAIVDDEDFDNVYQYYWHARPGWQRKTWYGYNCILGTLHRYILAAPAGLQVHHINGDGLDCRRENMELVTHAQHNRLQTRHPVGASGVRGVVWNARMDRWHARGTIGGQRVSLGYHRTIEGAQRALREAGLP